jgi:type IV pilus assembly protein PilO
MAVNLNAFVEELKRTNWNDPGTWHPAPKSLVLLAILAAVPVVGYFVHTNDQIETLDRARAEEERLKKQYVEKKSKAVNLDLYRQQRREIDTQFDALLRQLPDKSQMDALLIDINKVGLSHGLQFELFKPAASDTLKEFYAEKPIQLKVIGNYHDMGAFASDVSQLARIVTLNDVSITAGKDGNLTMDATARTFRYLSDTELQDQRKAAAAKKAGKKQ